MNAALMALYHYASLEVPAVLADADQAAEKAVAAAARALVGDAPESPESDSNDDPPDGRS